MSRDLIVADSAWRQVLGVERQTRRTPTRIKVAIVNTVPSGRPENNGLHRWLHRGDLLSTLRREADRLESRDLRELAERLAEATAPRDEVVA